MYQQCPPYAILWKNKDHINLLILSNGVYESLNNTHLDQIILKQAYDVQNSSKHEQSKDTYDLHTPTDQIPR